MLDNHSLVYVGHGRLLHLKILSEVVVDTRYVYTPHLVHSLKDWLSYIPLRQLNLGQVT